MTFTLLVYSLHGHLLEPCFFAFLSTTAAESNPQQCRALFFIFAVKSYPTVSAILWLASSRKSLSLLGCIISVSEKRTKAMNRSSSAAEGFHPRLLPNQPDPAYPVFRSSLLHTFPQHPDIPCPHGCRSQPQRIPANSQKSHCHYALASY